MRLTVRILGAEVLHISTDPRPPSRRVGQRPGGHVHRIQPATGAADPRTREGPRMSRRKRSEQDERLARARAGWVEVRAEVTPTTRREQALEAAAQAEWQRLGGAAAAPEWWREDTERRHGRVIDAVLAVPCDCAEGES